MTEAVPNLRSSASTEYLEGVAASHAGRSTKQELLAALAIGPGDRVLDVGCGPGTDLGALADAAGPTGSVFGVDQDPRMVATALSRTAERANVRVRHADAHRLPFDSCSLDRARAERVLMHVADPAAVLRELHRVLRVGGLLALAEPDWDTLAVDHPDLALSRAFTRYVAERVNRNHAVGRQLPRLAASTGFTLRAVRNQAVVLTDYSAGETILGLRRTTERAVVAGYFSPQDGEAWLAHLTSGTFFATASFITVLAEA